MLLAIITALYSALLISVGWRRVFLVTFPSERKKDSGSWLLSLLLLL